MARLPKNTRLVIEPKKLEDYLLNENHEVGRSKAAYFIGKGFRKESPSPLCKALETHARTRTVVAETTSEHGRKLIIECLMAFPDGKERCVRSVWVSDKPETFRFITSYPKKG